MSTGHWYNEFGSVFWITISTIITGSIGIGIRYCLKSKCKNFSCCWGLVQIDRNVDLEVQEELRELELGTHSPRRNESVNSLNIRRDNTL
jgi:hypothetical protein